VAATKNPAKGTEGITKVTARGRTRYKVRIRLEGGDRGEGQKFFIKTYDDFDEALRGRDQARNARHNGATNQITNRMTFREYSEQWLGTQNVRGTTLTSYRTHINRANRYIGDKKLSGIVRSDIEKIVNDYAAEGKSLTSSNYMLTRLRAIFRAAGPDGDQLMSGNPALRVKGKGEAKKDREAFDASEISKIKEALLGDENTKRDAGLWLLTLAGLRRGEAMGLKWSDIDLKAATVTVARSRVPHNAHGFDKTQVGRPKTKNGERVLHIKDMPELLAALRAMRDLQLRTFGVAQVREGWLALDAEGNPLDPKDWSARWDVAVEKAGVRGFTLHAARHTSVTTMRNAGVPDHIAAQWHGHDENIMRAVYSHAHADELQKAGAALAKALG
jgi:integrase